MARWRYGKKKILENIVVSTRFLKAGELEKSWLVIDATDMILGRLAVEVAKILRGKHKPTFTPHMDCGDNIIIVNAEKVALSGKKADRNKGKVYYRHTGFPGGIKETTAGKMLEGKNPHMVIRLAVQRMITKGPLGRQQLKNLYVYAGPDHPHAAQCPVVCDIASMNEKNRRR